MDDGRALLIGFTTSCCCCRFTLPPTLLYIYHSYRHFLEAGVVRRVLVVSSSNLNQFGSWILLQSLLKRWSCRGSGCSHVEIGSPNYSNNGLVREAGCLFLRRSHLSPSTCQVRSEVVVVVSIEKVAPQQHPLRHHL
jgi:hypothetical protein